MTVEELLRRQHAELRDLLAQVREAHADHVQIDFEALSDAVHVHWSVEERHLYPLLEALGYPDMYRSIEAHRALCHVVHDLAALCGDGPHFLSALKVLSAQLEQHIVDEERTVLPFLERTLSPARDAAVSRAMMETVAEIENENWLGAPEAWANPHTAA